MKTRLRPQVETVEARTLMSAGALDTSFGGTGKVTASLGGGSLGDTARAVAVQSDGKVVVGGGVAGRTSFGLVRYNSDGSLDGSFGTGGKLVLNGAGNFVAIAMSPDGKIVSVGTADITARGQTQTAWVVARTNGNGTTDSSFGSGGRVVTDISTVNDAPRAVVVQSDGKVVVAGSAGTPTTVEVARYSTNGTLDTSFGVGGKVAIPYSLGSTPLSGTAHNIVIDAQGRLLLAGSGSGSGTTPVVELARLNPGGNLDTTFGAEGKLEFTPPGSSYGSGITNVGVQSTGKIIVTGTAVFGSIGESYAARFNPANGSVDTSFGPSGNGFSYDTRIVSSSTGAPTRTLAIQPDDKIVLAGIAYPVKPGLGFALLRWTDAGTPDSTFGDGGLTSVAPTNPLEDPTAISLAPDGKIAMSGYSSTGSNGTVFATLRFLGDPPSTAAPASTHLATPAIAKTPDPTVVPLVLDDPSLLDDGNGNKRRRSP